MHGDVSRSAVKCEEAAMLAAMGNSEREIAEELGCGRQTIAKFSKTPEFRKVFEAARKDARRAFKDALNTRLVKKSIEMIDDALGYRSKSGRPNAVSARVALVLLASTGLIRKPGTKKETKKPASGTYLIKFRTPPSELPNAKPAALTHRSGGSNTKAD